MVLLTGCDKTTPACLMGAASVDLPTIVVAAMPMLTNLVVDVIYAWCDPRVRMDGAS